MERDVPGIWDAPSRRGGRKVTIVGLDAAGSATAYALILSSLCSELVLIDADERRAEGEAMDLSQAVPFGMPVRVRAGTYADSRGSHVTVIAAGATLGPGETRLGLLARNWGTFREIVPRLIEANPDGVIVVETDPVDVLTYGTWGISGLPRGRVIGSGTILDTARFRAHLGRYYEVDPRGVDALIIGEHGDSQVPVWSRATICGMQLHEFGAAQGRTHEQRTLDDISMETRNSAYEIIKRKGATSYTVASGLMRLLEAILRDEKAILPVSCVLRGQYGLRDVALSLPAVVDGDGVREHLALKLAPEEVAALHRSAAVIQEAIATLDFD